MEENTEGKKTIMLVDDDKFLLDMYSIKFGQANFNVLASLGSDDALKKLHEGAKPDLILFDMAMPGIDGMEFLEMVQKENLAPQALKIALSNQNEPSDMEKCKSLGCDDYFVKATMTPLELLNKVDSIMKSRG